MNNSDPNPSLRFTGLFIPREIYFMETIGIQEKVLLAVIDALFNEEHGGCFASNAYLANHCKLKENTIAIMIGNLKKLGLVEQVSFDGRKRVIRACKEKWFENNSCQSKADFEKNQTLTLKKIKPCVGEKSNPLIIYSKGDIKEDTLSTLSNGSTDSTAQDASRERVSYFLAKIKERDPKFHISPTIQRQWEKNFLSMHKDDDRTWEQIDELIKYSQEDDFWNGVINSPSRLRKNATSIISKMQSTAKTNTKDKASQEKAKQIQIDKNHDLTRVLLRNFSRKRYTIFADQVRIQTDQKTIDLVYEDPAFKENLTAILATLENTEE